MTKKTATKKATKKIVKNRPGIFGVVQGWGVARKNADGTVELLATAEGRMAIREIKRRDYPGPDFAIVQISANLIKYTK